MAGDTTEVELTETGALKVGEALEDYGNEYDTATAAVAVTLKQRLWDVAGTSNVDIGKESRAFALLPLETDTEKDVFKMVLEERDSQFLNQVLLNLE